MPTIFVSAGVTSTGLSVSGGSSLDVLQGGTTSGAVILNGGVEVVSSGGTAANTTVSNGGILSASTYGFDSGSVISSGGTLIASQATASGYGANAFADTVLLGGSAVVFSKGWINSASVQGGSVTVSAGGFAQETTLTAGGVLTISAGGSGNIALVGSGAAFIVSSGGLGSQTTVSNGGTETVLGLEAFSTVQSGGTVVVSQGGTTSAVFVANGGTEIVLTGGTAIVTSGTADYGLRASGGTINVSSGGTTSGAIVMNGGIEVVSSGGTAIVTTIGNGGTLSLLSGAAVGGLMQFSGGNGDLVIEALVPPSNPIAGFVSAGDTIDLDQLIYFGSTAVSFNGTTDTLTVTEGGVSATVQLAAADYTGVKWAAQSDSGGGTQILVACVAEGTLIGTDDGEVPVEMLVPGNRVLLARGGTAPVVWLGFRRLDCRRHPRPQDVMPVRVQAEAFGPSHPYADLLLSPDHSIYADGVLIPVRYLLNGVTVVQEPVSNITYWHVELPAHDVLLAHGLPIESYLETGNRGAFENGGAPLALHPDFAMTVWKEHGCAELVRDGAALEAVRSWLLDRAAALGYATTRDPDVRVIANRRILRPVVQSNIYRFHIPAAACGVRLLSRSTVPAQSRDDSTDARRLGVAVSRIVYAGGEIAIDDPRLSSGWHDAEGDGKAGAWRWTDGNAGLALPGGHVLDIEIAMAERYWVDERPGDFIGPEAVRAT